MKIELFEKEEENTIMSMNKYLVFVVDGTAATGPYWNNIFSAYLEKIIRHISQETKEDPKAILLLGLVVYMAHGLHISVLQANGWTTDVKMFLQQLSHLNFNGGSICGSAIADGLNGALALYPKPRIGAPKSLVAQIAAVKKHCILVAASNPNDMTKLLLLPIVRDGLFPDLRRESRSVTVDDVARVFAECSISLSVISPKHLPRLEQIFNVGNGVNEEVTSLAKNVEYNPHKYLVLLSEKFPEILPAFKEERMKMLRTPSPTSVEGQANFMEIERASGNQLTDEDMMIIQMLMDDPTLNLEDYIYPDETFTVMPGITPRVLNDPAWYQGSHNFQPEESGDPRVPQAGETQAAALKDSGFVGDLRAPQVAASAAPGLAGNLRDSQASSSESTDVPNPLSVNGQSEPRTTLGKVGQNGVFGNNQSGVGSNTLASIIERELQVHGGLDGFVAANLNNEQDGYVLSWVGNINCNHSGRIISLGQAKAYRKLTASASLTNDWPQTISFGRILRQQSVYKLTCRGRADIVVFETMASHRLYEELENRNCCIKIKLPFQIMLFFPRARERLSFSVLFRYLPPSRSETSHQ